MKPGIDECRVFLHAIRQKRDSCTLLREALSNAYDAGATRAEIEIRRSGPASVSLRVEDDGAGLTRADFRRFFGLGLSAKERARARGEAVIGEKGLGTKLYFSSRRVAVETRNARGEGWRGLLESPLDALERGRLPTYTLARAHVRFSSRTGTRVLISELRVPGSTALMDVEHVTRYLQWYSPAGSFRAALRVRGPRLRTRLVVHASAAAPDVRMVEGHPFPESSSPAGPADPRRFARRFPPFAFHVRDEAGRRAALVEVAGAVLGAEAHVVRERRLKKRYKGFFLGKDYFAVRAVNEEVAQGTGRWQSFHVLANCQALTLTSDRGDFVDAGEGGLYGSVVSALRQFQHAATSGRPFVYFGEQVEARDDFAGKHYAALLRLKAEKAKAKARDDLSVFLLSKARQTALGDLEPHERMGTLLAYHRELLERSASVRAGRRLLGVIPGPLPVLVLTSGGNPPTPPMLYGLVFHATDADLAAAEAMQLDGLVCWTRESGASPAHARLDTIALASLTAVGGGPKA